MCHEGDQLDAPLVKGAQLVDLVLGFTLQPDSLDDARQQVGDGAQLIAVGDREVPRLLGLDVEDSDDGVVPDERHRASR